MQLKSRDCTLFIAFCASKKQLEACFLEIYNIWDMHRTEFVTNEVIWRRLSWSLSLYPWIHYEKSLAIFPVSESCSDTRSKSLLFGVWVGRDLRIFTQASLPKDCGITLLQNLWNRAFPTVDRCSSCIVNRFKHVVGGGGVGVGGRGGKARDRALYIGGGEGSVQGDLPEQKDWQTQLKTLPSHNCIGDNTPSWGEPTSGCLLYLMRGWWVGGNSWWPTVWRDANNIFEYIPLWCYAWCKGWDTRRVF